MADRLFFGRVTDTGMIVLDRPHDYAQHTRAHAGKPVELILRRRRVKRSDQQNRWLWGVALQALVEHYGYEKAEQKHAKEALHYKLVEQCFGVRWDSKLRTHVPKARSSDLSTKEFSDYMEWLVRYAAQEYHLVISLPGDLDMSQIPDEEVPS